MSSVKLTASSFVTMPTTAHRSQNGISDQASYTALLLVGCGPTWRLGADRAACYVSDRVPSLTQIVMNLGLITVSSSCGLVGGATGGTN
ncbi:hypothetical protein Hamer_G009670 [Homarus americanus]|uniref:Uncharacterized protein n=1 Tax=Homarus americanus TaxID=6706 RepID=A0A8J5THL4_HOMAM|nr:hypothetical protein Hamer_G009670 [Homarus americanus]